MNDSDDNSDDYEVPVLADTDDEPFRVVMGRPVTLSRDEQAAFAGTGIDFSDPYDGSVKMKCKSCGREVWIGPRQQEAMKDMAGCVPMCPTCASKAMHDLNIAASQIHNLGNTHTRGN